MPISLFRSFTTINGDFDVETLWLRGSPAVAVFMVSLLIGNVVLLNLLIAIVSDEFDQFMERAGLEVREGPATTEVAHRALHATFVRIADIIMFTAHGAPYPCRPSWRSRECARKLVRCWR